MSAPNKWTCDVCDQAIGDVADAYVIWKVDGSMMRSGFKIIHQTNCDLKGYSGSCPLEDFVGEKGLTYLLSFLSIGPIKKNLGEGAGPLLVDVDEFVDLIRRVQVSNYEDARSKFNDPDLLEDYSDSNEVSPYFPDSLEKILKKY